LFELLLLTPSPYVETHFLFCPSEIVIPEMLTALKGNDDYDGVVGAILESYYNLPKNGKPNLPNEFSVFASCFAIVEHGGAHYVKVLSMATGTKCLGRADCQQDMKDCRVRDCHAEVLSKRCLQRFLLKCQYNYLDELRRDLEHEALARKSDLLVKNAHFPFEVLFRTRDRSVGASRDGRASGDRPVDVRGIDSPVQFRMKPQWQIGLFVSDPLCGDASIYPRREVGSSSSGTTSGGEAGPSPVAFTGAKLAGLRAVGREDAQALGAARTKSGRSDLPVSIAPASDLFCAVLCCVVPI
jgi:predicted metal-binding protein